MNKITIKELKNIISTLDDDKEVLIYNIYLENYQPKVELVKDLSDNKEYYKIIL